jgi:hypothetical protein
MGLAWAVSVNGPGSKWGSDRIDGPLVRQRAGILPLRLRPPPVTSPSLALSRLGGENRPRPKAGNRGLGLGPLVSPYKLGDRIARVVP